VGLDVGGELEAKARLRHLNWTENLARSKVQSVKRHGLKLLQVAFTLYIFLGLPIYIFGGIYVMDIT